MLRKVGAFVKPPARACVLMVAAGLHSPLLLLALAISGIGVINAQDGQECSMAGVSTLFNHLNENCCADGGACANGVPDTCTAQCATELLPFMATCQDSPIVTSMGSLYTDIQALAATCPTGSADMLLLMSQMSQLSAAVSMITSTTIPGRMLWIVMMLGSSGTSTAVLFGDCWWWIFTI